MALKATQGRDLEAASLRRWTASLKGWFSPTRIGTHTRLNPWIARTWLSLVITFRDCGMPSDVI